MSAPARVAVVRCATYDQAPQAMERAVALVGGWGFVPGQSALLKPNVVMGAEPERAVVTHPQVVTAAARAAVQAGAQPVLGESSGGPFTAAWVNRAMRNSGYEAALSAGAAFNRDFDSVERVVQGRMLRRVVLCRMAQGHGAIVNLCKLKTHGLAVFTGAAKNLFGLVPGTVKMQYHAKYPGSADFAAALNDIAIAVGDALHVMDGVIGMEGEGPSHGSPRHAGVILASRNPWALDHVAASLIGIDPQDVPMLRDALERGLYDPQAIELAGDQVEAPVCRFELPSARRGLLSLLNAGPLATLLRKFRGAKPYVVKKKCEGCGLCQRTCPPTAIQMRKGRPAFDYRKCIRCYCCQELCPQGAVKVRRGV